MEESEPMRKLWQYKATFRLPEEGAIGVVDTSYMRQFVLGAPKSFTSEERFQQIRDENMFYNRLAVIVNHNTTFPQEAIQEKDQYLIDLQRRAKNWQGFLSTHLKGKPNGGRMRLINIDSRRDLEEYSEQRINLARKGRAVLNKVLMVNPTEPNISQAGWNNYQQIMSALMEISKHPSLAKQEREERFRREHIVESHKHNDKAILAKSIAISYTNPAYLFTADNDIFRMWGAFYNNLGQLSVQHQFAIPADPVNLVYNSQGHFSLSRLNAHPKLIKFGKVGVGIGILNLSELREPRSLERVVSTQETMVEIKV